MYCETFLKNCKKVKRYRHNTYIAPQAATAAAAALYVTDSAITTFKCWLFSSNYPQPTTLVGTFTDSFIHQVTAEILK